MQVPLWDHDTIFSPVLGKFLDELGVDRDSKVMMQLLDSHSLCGHGRCHSIASALSKCPGAAGCCAC